MAKGLDQPIEAITGRACFITEMHVIKLRGYSLNYAAHAGIGCINLAEIAYLSIPARFGNSNRILQLSDIDSDKSFSIICHSSSSCDEDRLGPSEQPSEDQCRASHLRREDGHTVLHMGRDSWTQLFIDALKQELSKGTCQYEKVRRLLLRHH
jgi:hypothetical protein